MLHSYKYITTPAGWLKFFIMSLTDYLRDMIVPTMRSSYMRIYAM